MWRYFNMMERLEEAHHEDLMRSRRRRRTLRAYGSEDMSGNEFINSFRLNREQFEGLMEDLEPHIKESTRVGDISCATKVEATLGFYASGSYQTVVGQHSATTMSQPSVSRAIREVTDALNHPLVIQKYIHFPQNALERNEIKARFYQRHGIPGVVGCIDCTHVAIVKPVEYEERFFNRKYYHSKNVQMVCDADYNIISVDASFPGASHDSFIFNQHSLKTHLEGLNQQGEHVYLLGDSGYALRSYMITPIMDALPRTPEEHFNIIQKSTRSTVERTFGVLKGRWRCLLSARKLHYDPVTAGKIVNACTVLHNLCNKTRAPYVPLTQPEQLLENELNLRFEPEAQPEIPGHRRVNYELERGRAQRNQLVNILWEHRRNPPLLPDPAAQ